MSLIALLAAGATTASPVDPVDPTPPPVAPTWELLTPLGADPLFYDPASVPAIDLSQPINLLADGNSISTAFYSDIGGTAEAIAKTREFQNIFTPLNQRPYQAQGGTTLNPILPISSEEIG